MGFDRGALTGHVHPRTPDPHYTLSTHLGHPNLSRNAVQLFLDPRFCFIMIFNITILLVFGRKYLICEIWPVNPCLASFSFPRDYSASIVGFVGFGMFFRISSSTVATAS